jgi:hypothetical protein
MPQYPCSSEYVKFVPNNKKNKQLRAVFQKSAIWKPGSTGRITITFKDEEAAWSHIGSNSTNEYPSMNLGFIDPPFVSFSFNDKFYDINKIPSFKNAMRNYCNDPLNPGTCKKSGPTGSINWQPGSTVVHETMHSLSSVHMHQVDLYNSNPIKLDVEAVRRYYRANNMTDSDAEVNVIERYSCDPSKSTCDYIGSPYDPDSVMLYNLPDDWVIGKNPTYPNYVMSILDKEWLTKTYPKEPSNLSNWPEITVEFVDHPINAYGFQESGTVTDNLGWKQAWVQKVIIESIVPLVGIRYRFVDANGAVITIKPLEVVERPILITDGPLITEGPVIKKKIFPIRKRKEGFLDGFTGNSEIAVIVLIIIVIVIVIVVISTRSKKIY